MIWRYALPGPRIITIFSNVHSPAVVTERERKRALVRADTTLNGLYRACKDSHDTVKKDYKLFFRDQFEHAVFISVAIDTLYFSDSNDLHAFFRDRPSLQSSFELRSIRYLAREYRPPMHRPEQIRDLYNFYTLYKAIGLFPGLEKMFLLSERTVDEFETEVFLSEFQRQFIVFGPRAMQEHYDETLLSRVKIMIVDRAKFLANSGYSAWLSK